MKRVIKFRRPYFRYSDNKFEYFDYWGVNLQIAKEVYVLKTPGSSSHHYGGDDQQFTGLFDKQGVEIYEGDIFKSKQEYADVKSDIWQVVFDEGQFCGESKRQGLVHLNYWSKSEIEKIGDIYSNPELL